MPCCSSVARGPMPDSISSCGVLNAPPARITSRAANTWRVLPAAGARPRMRRRTAARRSRYSTPIARFAVVEQHPRRERVQLDLAADRDALRPRRARARARRPADGPSSSAACSAGRSRRPRRRASRWDRAGCRDARADRRRSRRPRGCCSTARADSRIVLPQIAVLEDAASGRGLLGLQPARPAVAARVVAEPARARSSARCSQRSMRSKYVAHVLGAPRRVAGEIGELVPVGVVRVDEDHRVVRGAAAERGRARIQHAVDRLPSTSSRYFGSRPLPRLVGVVADEEVPADARRSRSRAHETPGTS